jgi:hypothetical protein
MKTIQLKITKEKLNGQDVFFSTYDLLKTAINNPVQGGFDVDEMIKRLRLLNKLDAHKEVFSKEYLPNEEGYLLVNETFELEDADFDKLKELFKNCKWGVVSQTIVDIAAELK